MCVSTPSFSINVCFIHASNEPCSRACIDIWRMPQWMLRVIGACSAQIETECSIAELYYDIQGYGDEKTSLQ